MPGGEQGGVGAEEKTAQADKQRRNRRRQRLIQPAQNDVKRKNRPDESGRSLHAHFVAARHVGNDQQGGAQRDFLGVQPALAGAQQQQPDGGQKINRVEELQAEQEIAAALAPNFLVLPPQQRVCKDFAKKLLTRCFWESMMMGYSGWITCLAFEIHD